MKLRLETSNRKPESQEASLEALPKVKVCQADAGCIRFTNKGNSHDQFFVILFHGIPCFLALGMTAAKRMKDMKQCGAGLITSGLIIPGVFAKTGILIAHAFSFAVQTPFQLAMYELFAVLCGSSSYIAAHAIRRIVIPESSPTLPLAASQGLTFRYKVLLGIPIHLAIAEHILRRYPVV